MIINELKQFKNESITVGELINILSELNPDDKVFGFERIERRTNSIGRHYVLISDDTTQVEEEDE